MATRLFTAGGSPTISPTPASGWDDLGAFESVEASTTAGDYVQTIGVQPGSGVANDDVLAFQMIYGPVEAGSITGTVKGQFGAREVDTLTNARAQVTIRVIAPNGSTVRGTLLALDTAAIANEFVVSGTTPQNREFPRGGAVALSSVTASAGDFVVIEVGFRNHGTDTANVRVLSGEASATTNLPENETQDLTSGTTYRGWIEFSQTIDPYVVSAPAGAATGTGAAYNATISNFAPDRSIAVNSVNIANKVRFDSFSFTEVADQGTVGIGGFALDDSTAALDVPALKPVTFNEYRAPAEPRLFTGFTQERSTQRGPSAAAGQREWDVEVVDINVLFSDYVMTGSGANRGAETDYARVTWLLTTALNTVGGVTAGVVPNSNTVDMDAVDYRGRKARDVIAECAEAAGKNYFIYYHSSGPLLFYDLHTSSSLASSARISDVATDVDSVTTWGGTAAKVHKSPDRVYSTVHLKYKKGTKIVSSATTLASFRRRDVALTDLSVKTSAKALAKANRFLDGPASSELVTVSQVSVDVPAANVNDIRAGDRIEIKLTRHGISAFTWYRILRRTVSATTDVRYRLTLTLADTVLPSIFVNGRGGEEIWEEKSNATEDDATVIVDAGGITITNGALTVTNGGSIVIIDGTSNMFKIADSGTMSRTQGAGSLGNGTTTLTSLGAWTYVPAHIAMMTYSVGTEQTSGGHDFGGNSGRYAATSSGGSPTSEFIANDLWAFLTVALNGSDEAVLRFYVNNRLGTSHTHYLRYYILIEAGI